MARGRGGSVFREILVVVVFLSFAAAVASAFAADLYVPDGYKTIQAAIAAANNGDSVIVRDGRYTGFGNYNVRFLGKAITVRSEKGAERCIIHGGGALPSAFRFVGGEKADSLLQGFTIQGFSNSGIVCDGSSPTVSNCIIKGNMDGHGAGMRCEHASSPVIKQCAFLYNNVRGLFAAGKSEPKIYDSIIQQNEWCGFHAEAGSKVTAVNTVLAENWYGGSAFDTSSLIIRDCMILGNSDSGILVEDSRGHCTLSNTVLARNGYAGIETYSSQVKAVNCSIVGNGRGVVSEKVPVVVNSVIWGNKKSQVSGDANITYSDLQGGFAGTGNIDADPGFVSPGDSDLHLQSTSPCIDKGSGSVAGLPSKDKNGRPRIAGKTVDMGAYEYNSTMPPMQVVSVRAIDHSASEEGDLGRLKLTRSSAAGSATDLSLKVFGSSDNGIDYVKIPLSVTIASSTKTKSVVVKPIKDSLVEGVEDAEVLLNNSTRYETALPYTVVQISEADQSQSRLLWKFQMGGSGGFPSVGADGTVYVGSSDSYLYAVSPKGELKWKFQAVEGGAYGSFSTAIGANGTIYIASSDSYLYAITPEGKLEWKRQGVSGSGAYPAIGATGTIYIASPDSYLYAVSPNGKLRWKLQDVSGSGHPAVIGPDGTIYVGALDHVYAINPSGTKKWEFQLGDQLVYSAIVDFDGTVYVGAEDSYVYAISSEGDLKWKCQTAGIVCPRSIGADGTIYAVSSVGVSMECFRYAIHAIDPSGKVKWGFGPGCNSGISTPAVGSDGMIYVGSSDSYLYALDVDGTVRWKFKAGAGMTSPVVAPGGTIYFGSSDANLYAIKSDSDGLAKSAWPMGRRDEKHTACVAGVSQ